MLFHKFSHRCLNKASCRTPLSFMSDPFSDGRTPKWACSTLKWSSYANIDPSKWTHSTLKWPSHAKSDPTLTYMSYMYGASRSLLRQIYKIIEKPLVFQWCLHFSGSQKHFYMHLPIWDRFGTDLGPIWDLKWRFLTLTSAYVWTKYAKRAII